MPSLRRGWQEAIHEHIVRDKYRKWAKVMKETMRIQHKPGDVLEVDWAGNTFTIWKSITGESSPAYLFVAVLPCSGYAYVEACPDMKLGKPADVPCPRICLFRRRDKASDLNRSHQELAEHYDTAVVPARVEHSYDKSHAEGTVRLASM